VCKDFRRHFFPKFLSAYPNEQREKVSTKKLIYKRFETNTYFSIYQYFSYILDSEKRHHVSPFIPTVMAKLFDLDQCTRPCYEKEQNIHFYFNHPHKSELVYIKPRASGLMYCKSGCCFMWKVV